MKSMNEIKADISGVIQEIRAQNGQLVEFGQTIILIDQTPPA
jgi:biotin carboxyl carrier protein